jgi:hypothetical protein
LILLMLDQFQNMDKVEKLTIIYIKTYFKANGLSPQGETHRAKLKMLGPF